MAPEASIAIQRSSLVTRECFSRERLPVYPNELKIIVVQRRPKVWWYRKDEPANFKSPPRNFLAQNSARVLPSIFWLLFSINTSLYWIFTENLLFFFNHIRDSGWLCVALWSLCFAFIKSCTNIKQMKFDGKLWLSKS